MEGGTEEDSRKTFNGSLLTYRSPLSLLSVCALFYSSVPFHIYTTFATQESSLETLSSSLQRRRRKARNSSLLSFQLR